MIVHIEHPHHGSVQADVDLTAHAHKCDVTFTVPEVDALFRWAAWIDQYGLVHEDAALDLSPELWRGGHDLLVAVFERRPISTDRNDDLGSLFALGYVDDLERDGGNPCRNRLTVTPGRGMSVLLRPHWHCLPCRSWALADPDQPILATCQHCGRPVEIRHAVPRVEEVGK